MDNQKLVGWGKLVQIKQWNPQNRL
jgi:hypothetical protein